MAWFKREDTRIINDPTKTVRTEGLWTKCGHCGQPLFKADLEANLQVCPKCGYHFRFDARSRVAQLLEPGYELVDLDLRSTDPLHFTDLKPYKRRLAEAQQKTGLNDAIVNATGEIAPGQPVVLSVMEYAFIAARHGLTSAVTATTTLAGRYYGAEHDRITLGQFSRAMSEWDLLTYLASHEGFDVFVQGATLYFQPASKAAPIAIDVVDCLSVSLEQSFTLARDIEVTVKSWNTRQQAAFTQTARSTARSGTRRSGPPQRIVVVRPNLSTNEALQLAQRVLADLSRHERIVRAELPGELVLTSHSQSPCAAPGRISTRLTSSPNSTGILAWITASPSAFASRTPARPAKPKAST